MLIVVAGLATMLLFGRAGPTLPETA